MKRTPGSVDPNAVFGERDPISRSNRASQRDGDPSVERAKAGNVVTAQIR